MTLDTPYDILPHMNIKKIFEQALNDNSLWFRPLSWKGTGQAFQVQDGETVIVPAQKFNSYMTPKVKFFIEDWEIVSPDVVLDEL